MSFDPTLSQGGSDRLRSREMSRQPGPPGQPPAAVPGVDIERLLGQGAFGEVWLGVERNTGRRVAVKFYSHRGGLDWSLLTREVEKLAFLFNDRYVVQLLSVGWDAEPPYYVMEFLDRGSLAERLQQGAMPIHEALELFRDVAIGLVHAHGKGVLHCDLKPANVLLDQDGRSRLADFGQSRLTHEQAPALGTLFYMAPEQADLLAVPDARWDVYALGALLYCMITGSPPHRTPEAVQALERNLDLEKRLATYRRMIRKGAAPVEHRRTSGVDSALAEIIDRCLAVEPARRYPNVQAVLEACNARAARRAFRPTMLVGTLGPLLLLIVVSLFAWQGFTTAVRRSEDALSERALANNLLTAQYVAGLAGKELHRRCNAVEQVARSPQIPALLDELDRDPTLVELAAKLAATDPNDPAAQTLRKQFLSHPVRRKVQKQFDAMLPEWMRPPTSEASNGSPGAQDVASWFFCDARGMSTLRTPESTTLGRNYAWRSFFHGGPRDRDPSWRPAAGEHLSETTLSAVFQSQAGGNPWIVAVATPVIRPGDGAFLGIVALTVRVNRFVELSGNDDQFAVLVDLRDGDHRGMVLQHPLFDRVLRRGEKLPLRFREYRLSPEALPDRPQTMRDYRDPLAADPDGGDYDQHWLAQMEPIVFRNRNSGWAVIVQEAYRQSLGDTLTDLRASLIGYGLAALGMVALVLAGLWVLVYCWMRETTLLRAGGVAGGGTEISSTPATPSETQ